MIRSLFKINRLVLICLLFVAPSCNLSAQEYLLTPSASLAPYEKWTGESPGALSVKRNDKVYLSFRVRLNARSFSTGSAPAFRVYFDRVPIEISRLANKQSSYNISASAHRIWYSPDGRFDALYDDFEKTSPPSWGRTHDYAFDITDLVEHGKKQPVIIENLFDSVPETVLELKECKISVGPVMTRNPFPENPLPYYLSEGFARWRRQATARHQGIGVTLETTTNLAQPLELTTPPRLPDFSATASGNAAMGIDVHFPGWESIPLQTIIGTPNAQWQTGQDFEKFAQSGRQATWQTPAYRLERTFTPDAHGIVVRDRITNLTNQDLPFAILYQLDAGNLARLKEFRLYGKQESAFYANTTPSRESASYPVGYVRDEKRAYAFVMEDDALRPQGSVMVWDSFVNFGTDMVCLSPQASHTFQFRIIGAPSGNYFEVLNRLRNAWNNYQTIPGLFGFVYPRGIDAKLKTPEQVKSFFESTGITVPAIPNSSPVLSDSTGTERRMLYGVEPEDMIREGLTSTSDPFAGLMKEAGLDLPVLIYMDPHLIRSDGKKEILDSVADGIVEDIKGDRLDYRPGWLHVVLPQSDNSIGRKIHKNLETYFDRPYIRGMFLDEWDHSRARYSFQKSDGLTARLNSDLSLKAKIGFVPLLTKGFQRETVDFLQQKKAVTYVNQMDQTAFSQTLPLVHFAEPTQYDHYLLRSAQIARTPLSLNLKRSQGVWNDTYEFLKGGVLLTYYARRLYGDHLLKYVYPIKVVAAEAGCVLAEDKIVTLRSGAYSFQDNSPLEALIFAAPDGNLKRKAASQPASNGANRISLTLDSQKQEIALLRKIKP